MLDRKANWQRSYLHTSWVLDREPVRLDLAVHRRNLVKDDCMQAFIAWLGGCPLFMAQAGLCGYVLNHPGG